MLSTLSSHYDPRLVALSVLIAVLASGAALDLAGRVTGTHGRARALWLTGGAFAMGVGIWSMHYTGMLAFRLPIVVHYHTPTVALSLLAAILASAVALELASRETLGGVRVAVGSVVMGSGIAAMHYIGMAAVRLEAVVDWNTLVVALSIAIAITVSAVALALAFRFGHAAARAWTWQKLASAVVMGLAVSSMHYTGMAAAHFISRPGPVDTAGATTVSAVGTAAVVATTVAVLVLAIATSLVDRRIAGVRERAAAALEASEARYRFSFEANPIPMWVADRVTGGFVMVNDAAVQQYEFSRQEFLARTIRDIRPPEDVALLDRYLTDRPPGLQVAAGVWRHRRKSGAVFPAEVSSHEILFDGRQAILVMAVDVSERERAQSALRERERQLADAQAVAHVGSWEWDIPNSRITWSDELYRMYGVPLGSPVGYGQFVERLHPEDRRRVEDIVAEGLAARRAIEFECRIVRPDGEVRHVLGRSVVSVDAAGVPVRMAGTSFDITDVKAAEEKQRALIQQLQTALLEVKTLRGILPICATCKRVHTEEGSWEQVESYVRQRTNAEFSHGLCPDCAAATWGAAG